MPVPVTTECRTEAEAASVRLAAAFAAQMHQLAQAAPDGQVLHLAEAHALARGRNLLRDALQAAAQSRVDAAEQGGGRLKGRHGRGLMTAVGPVRLERSYAQCPACSQRDFPADRLLGLGGWLTPRALAMARRAGAADPFREAEALLRELCGWSVDADAPRRRCREQAGPPRAARGVRRRPGRL